MSARQPLLATENLAVGYTNGPPVLQDVTFTANPGQRIAVLGPNGGGKTTLFRALLHELRPTQGTLTTTGRCASVPQTERSRLDFPVSALDVALMGTIPSRRWWRRPSRTDRAAARAALKRVDLADRAERTYGELSGGQRQRVLIARALVQNAQILLLDEPFTGLDTMSAARLEELLRALADEGRAVLIATHDLEQARRWDRVLCVNGRQVAFGVPAETLTHDVLAQTYGAAIVTLPGEDPAAPHHAILPPHHHHHDAPPH
ncbi:MAG TPA: metal ABC transporter ATP-binding protein [Conexibacter sp.]|jgi:ABC-type Mn2+/Zn2+ transport system ATPase subunit|nr:metal ABC transporter ATP-binding protein [Conexibacter sp.]